MPGDYHNSQEELVLSAKEIAQRKQWLGLTPADEEMVVEIDRDLGDYTQALIDRLYDHFLSFDETRSFFPDEETLKRASSAQMRYFQRLTKGNYDAQYVKERLQVGYTHYRVDLDPKWYLGAYSKVLDFFLERMAICYAQDTQKLCKAIAVLRKIIFLDMGLAIDTYISAKQHALRAHQDIIRELETERRVTQSILANAPVGIVNVDHEFCCLGCNEQFVKIMALPESGNIVGRNLFEIAPGLPRELFEGVLQSGQPFSASGRAINLSSPALGDNRFWDLAIWPIKGADAKVTGIVAQFADVSDRLLLQQQREDFVATLTHDLKTPILAANRAVKLLIEGDFGPVAPAQAEILQTIHQSNEALYTLVRTLLDVYRYDSGAKKLVLRACDLRDIINKLVAELKPLAESKRINLIGRLPDIVGEVICDNEEIRRVVQNLLDNSLKFTPAGGEIVVELAQEDGVATIKVKDNGKGVSPEEQSKLFQRFWQASSSGRYYASTGLGLYLCRQIVELHGGHIWCESTPGKGSTFTFTIDGRES